MFRKNNTTKNTLSGYNIDQKKKESEFPFIYLSLSGMPMSNKIVFISYKFIVEIIEYQIIFKISDSVIGTFHIY